MWVKKQPVYGDQIRVSRGFYSHHGIYESDDIVYNFAAPKGSEIDPEQAEVIISTLADFLKGGVLEVREYDSEDLLKKKSPNEVIAYAKNHLGEKGYNIFSNNCEHFANRCVFGVSDSHQVDQVKELLKAFFK